MRGMLRYPVGAADVCRLVGIGAGHRRIRLAASNGRVVRDRCLGLGRCLVQPSQSGNACEVSDYPHQWFRILRLHLFRGHRMNRRFFVLSGLATLGGLACGIPVCAFAATVSAAKLDRAEAFNRHRGGVPTALLVDGSGTMGHAYGAATANHMFIISGDAALVYAGGIDDSGSMKPEQVAKSRNFVRAALEDLVAGRAVSTPRTDPVGCALAYSGAAA
jgi:hypothetical protein